MILCFFPAGIERDAVSTFTKYISPDAAKPIPITEAMRNDIVGKNEFTASSFQSCSVPIKMSLTHHTLVFVFIFMNFKGSYKKIDYKY